MESRFAAFLILYIGRVNPNLFFEEMLLCKEHKLHHHVHGREHRAAQSRDLAEEEAIGVCGIGRAVDVLHVEVEVERPLAEVKLFVHAQIELVCRRQTQGVEASIVQIGRVAEPPNGFLCRELRVDRCIGRTAQSAPARGKAHAFENGDGIVAIGLVETFHHERKAFVRLIVHTHHALEACAKAE